MNSKDFMEWFDSMDVLKNKKYLSLIQTPVLNHMESKVYLLIICLSQHKNKEKHEESKEEESSKIKKWKKAEYVMKICIFSIITYIGFSEKSSASFSRLGSSLEFSSSKVANCAPYVESAQQSLVYRIREYFRNIFTTHTSQTCVSGANAAKDDQEQKQLLLKNNKMKAN